MSVRINGKKLDISSIRVSTHAYNRYLERFKTKYNKRSLEHVSVVIKSALGLSQLVGRKRDENGKEGYLLVAKDVLGSGMKIILADDLKTVLTVMPQEKMALPDPKEAALTTIYVPLQTKVNELYAKEYRKLERLERQLEKKTITAEYELNYEIAALKLRMFKTRSDSVKLACQARINAIEQELRHMKQEVIQVKSTRTKIIKYIAAV